MAVVESLVGLFREIGARLTCDCVGEAVREALRRAMEQAGEGPGSVDEFARLFSQDVSSPSLLPPVKRALTRHKAVALVPSLAAPTSQSDNSSKRIIK